jgi:hypothetical protein
MKHSRIALVGLVAVAILAAACGGVAPEESAPVPQPKLLYFYADW